MPGAGIACLWGGDQGGAGVWEACLCPLGIHFACCLRNEEEESRTGSQEKPPDNHTHRGGAQKDKRRERGHTHADRPTGDRHTDGPARPRLPGAQREAQTDIRCPPTWGPAVGTSPAGVLPVLGLPGHAAPWGGPPASAYSLEPSPTKLLNKLAARNASSWAPAHPPSPTESGEPCSPGSPAPLGGPGSQGDDLPAQPCSQQTRAFAVCCSF